MAHEIVEHYGSREERRHVAALRDSGMEVVFGDPEDRPCELLPPEAFPTPEEVRPVPELRRGDGTPDEETGPDCRAAYWQFFSSCAGWPHPPRRGSSTTRFAMRTRIEPAERWIHLLHAGADRAMEALELARYHRADIRYAENRARVALATRDGWETEETFASGSELALGLRRLGLERLMLRTHRSEEAFIDAADAKMTTHRPG